MTALLQPWKEVKNPPGLLLNLLMILMGIRCNLQVFPDRQISKDPSPFRYQRDSQATHDVMGRKLCQISSLKVHLPRTIGRSFRRGEAHDAHERCRFSSSIGTDQGNDLPFLHIKGNIMQGFDRSLTYMQIFNGQEHQSISFPR